MSNLTEEQKNALEVMEQDENIFLTGEAGTGKSYLLREYINRHKNECVVCAPTGVAAINVKGVTLHRLFKIPLYPLSPNEFTIGYKINKAILKAKIVIIDEISMCRFDVFQYVINTIQEAENVNGIHKKIIVVGDFFQLSPVILDKDKEILSHYWRNGVYTDGFAFHTFAWKDLNFKTIVLKEIIRQNNKEFQYYLNRVRVGDVSSLNWFKNNSCRYMIPNTIFLCPTNKKAQTINEYESNKLTSPVRIFESESIGCVSESDKPTEDVLELKVGMQVMTIVNSPDNSYQNGTIGSITEFKDNSIVIKTNTNTVVEVEKYTWNICNYKVNESGELELEIIGSYTQIPLKIAYAITIHKSQGQTYDKVNIDPACFTEGQLYVALSRAKDINNIYFDKPLLPFYLKTSSDVIQFYNNLI